MSPPKKVIPVEVKNEEPLPVEVKHDVISERMKALTPILLAAITAISSWAALNASRAATTAQHTAVMQAVSDSVRQVALDSISHVTTSTHKIVNSEKAFRAAQNEALIQLLHKNDIPIPEALRTQAVPDTMSRP